MELIDTIKAFLVPTENRLLGSAKLKYTISEIQKIDIF
jgi:hypothetical protein